MFFHKSVDIISCDVTAPCVQLRLCSCARLITEGQASCGPSASCGASASCDSGSSLVIGCYWQTDGFTSTWLNLFTAILDHSLLLS